MERIIAIKNLMIEIIRSIHYIINNRAEEIEMNVFTGYKSETAIELDNLWSKYWTLADELKAACLDDSTIYSGIISSIGEEAKLEKPVDKTRVFLTIEDLEEVETLKKIRREELRLEAIIKEVNFYIEMSKKPAMQDHIKEINSELLKRKKMLEEQQAIIKQLTKGIKPKQKPVEAAMQVAAKAEEVTTASKEDVTIQEGHSNNEVVTQMDDNSMTIGSDKEDAEFWDLVDKTTTDKKMDLANEVWGDLSSLYNEATTPDEVVIGEDEYININELTYESQEVWKPIKDYPYEVSTKGRVRISSTKEEVRVVTVISGVKKIFLNGRWIPLAKLIYAMFIEGGVKEVTYIDNNIHNNHILNLKAA